VRAGTGLFWVHTGGSVTATGPNNGSKWTTIVGSWDGSASNGMTAHVEFGDGGSVMGWIKNGDGELIAVITGNIAAQISLTHKDGTTHTLTLY